MLIDSHCHLDRLDLAPYGGELAALLDDASRQGLAGVLCVAVNWEAYPAMRRLIAQYPRVWASVGVHPDETQGHDPSVDELTECANDERVIAIGETGLDYYREAGAAAAQQARFRRHIQAARAVRKPLIIHTRAARADTVRILREEGAGEVGGVLHCFTEDWETAQAALDLNFYVSFSGIVTFKNAAELRAVAKLIPADRLLIETDAPYLTPAPLRGKANYPHYVKYVAECLAEVRQVPAGEIAARSAENFHRLFAVS